MRPLVLGGDHSVTHYVLEAALTEVERFGIIHFDAHHDMTPSRTVSHAQVFATALASPQVEHILQIGLRVIERMPLYAARAPSPKRTVISARAAARGAALAALAALPRDLPYYLSFDIDCIDAATVRETGTPVFAGLSVELAAELVDYAARTFELLGADFVEVTGTHGPFNAAATIAAGLLQRCVLGESPFEPLSSDTYML
jgi:arginase family enzyme